jgi:hypothetical protein
MYKYKAYGLSIDSEISLPKLLTNDSNADVKIYFQKLDNDNFNSHISGKNFKVTNDATYLFFKNSPLIKIYDGNKILINPSVDIDKNLLRDLILGTSFAILRHQQGLLVLHASSVNIDGHSVVFLGDTGQGKSTTAFALNRRGYPLVSDDVLPLQVFENDSPLVYPAYPGLKLSSEVLLKNGYGKNKFKNSQESRKYLLDVNEFSSDSIPIKKIYILKRGMNFDVKKISPQNAIIELINNSFCFPSFNNLEKSSNLLQCANVVKNVPIKTLFIKNSLDMMPELIKTVENDFNY